jgi:hypothetical protein
MHPSTLHPKHETPTAKRQTLRNENFAQMEHGATRNYEIWNDRKEDEEGQRAEREADEEGDAMKALENRLVRPLSPRP